MLEEYSITIIIKGYINWDQLQWNSPNTRKISAVIIEIRGKIKNLYIMLIIEIGRHKKKRKGTGNENIKFIAINIGKSS